MKAHVCTDDNEQADQTAKEGASGGAHMKVAKTLLRYTEQTKN